MQIKYKMLPLPHCKACGRILDVDADKDVEAGFLDGVSFFVCARCMYLESILMGEN